MNEKKPYDINIIDSEIISNYGNKVIKCLLTKDQELIRILKERGKEMPYSLATLASENCFIELMKENKDNNIAIVGAMCSGKSVLWKQIMPEYDVQYGRDEEGYDEGHQIYTTHSMYHISKNLQNNNSCIIKVERNLDDSVNCILEKRDWLAKKLDYNKEKIKEEIIDQQNYWKNELKKINTNIIKVKLE